MLLSFTVWLTPPLSCCLSLCSSEFSSRFLSITFYPLKTDEIMLSISSFNHDMSVILCIISLIIIRIAWLCADLIFPHNCPQTNQACCSQFCPQRTHILSCRPICFAISILLVHKVAWGAAPVYLCYGYVTAFLMFFVTHCGSGTLIKCYYNIWETLTQILSLSGSDREMIPGAI